MFFLESKVRIQALPHGALNCWSQVWGRLWCFAEGLLEVWCFLGLQIQGVQIDHPITEYTVLDIHVTVAFEEGDRRKTYFTGFPRGFV